MASSAFADFFATQEDTTFKYVFLVRNTSPEPFDIYGMLIGAQYDVAVVPGGLQNIVPVSSPPGWDLIPSTPIYGFLFAQTNFNGSAAASGYIFPGAVGVFAFDSSTPPPSTLVFGCCFYNGDNEWGFCYNGTAEQVLCVAPRQFPRPWELPNPALEQKRRISSAKALMRGTTSRTIGGKDGEPSVDITYDRFGNVIKISRNTEHLLSRTK
ncbi:MAG TPA: hypothetical protein VLW84_11435 [Terriglobales bacterium]|nr:hypothetical protein [Terriglobales bacterium]